MTSNIPYYLKLALLFLCSLLLAFGLSQLDSRYFHTAHFWLPVIFFELTTLAIHFFLTQKSSEPKEFIFKYLAVSMARLLLCMVCVLIYALVNKPGALAFTCHFMIQYLIYTVYEIIVILKQLRQSN